MSIIEEIKEIERDENHRSRIGLCEYGPDLDDLIALAESHERLLAAIKACRGVKGLGISVPVSANVELVKAIEEAEKL